MPALKPRLPANHPKARRSIFQFKPTIHHEISPFLNVFRSYLHESRFDKNKNKSRDLDNETKILREIMTLKEGRPYYRYFDINLVTKEIKKLAGQNEDGSIVCAETQMENACKFIAEHTGKKVVGYLYLEPYSLPKYVTAPFIGDLNLILIKMKNETFATANTHNLFPTNGNLFCKSCRKQYQEAWKHTSKCKARCPHCFGMGVGFPCPEVLPPGEWLHCENCLFEFKSQKCFDRHLKTACSKKRKCEKI